MKHVYVTAKNRKELIVVFLGNLCYAQKQFAGSPLKEDRSILMVLGRLPGGKYQQFKVVKKKEWQGPFLAQSGTTEMILDPYVLVSDPLPKEVAYIDPMLNSETRSGDILILANQEKEW